jgi:hypothetical protein
VLALGDGRTAAALRLHHSMADGTTAMAIVRALLLDQNGAAPGGDDRAAALPSAAGPGRAELWPTEELLARIDGPHGAADSRAADGE